MSQEEERYEQYTQQQQEQWEAKCTRCGACCGSTEDPCENLRKEENGKYYCSVYNHRYGKWHTVSGKEFYCISIREKIASGFSWPGDEHCGYK